MVKFHMVAGLITIVFGLLIVIFNKPVAKFLTLGAKIKNLNPINPLVKIKDYDPKSKKAKIIMIILGIFFIIGGLIAIFFPQVMNLP